MTWPFQLRRAVTNRHRHAIEQASRRWRGGRRDGLARTSRKILISAQPVTPSTTARPSRARSSVRRRGARGRARRTATALMKRAAAAPRRASSSLVCSQAPRRRLLPNPGPPPSRARASARSSLSLTRRRGSCGRCSPSVLAARFLCCFWMLLFWTCVKRCRQRAFRQVCCLLQRERLRTSRESVPNEQRERGFVFFCGGLLVSYS